MKIKLVINNKPFPAPLSYFNAFSLKVKGKITVLNWEFNIKDIENQIQRDTYAIYYKK